MIAKITAGNSIQGCLEYQEKDNYKKNKVKSSDNDTGNLSKLIAIENQFFPEANLTKVLDHQSKPKELAKMFQQWNQKNQSIKSNVFHCSLNFHKSDTLSEDKLRAITLEFMQGMGYENVPYVVYQHFDSDHTHIHIVSSRINEDGKKVKDSKEVKRAMELCRHLEQKHYLQPVNSKYIQEFNRSLRSSLSTSEQFNRGYVSRCLVSALRVVENRDIDRLSAYLLDKHDIKLFEKEGRLTFAHSKDGKKPIYGSSIQKNLFQNISRHLDKNLSQYYQFVHRQSLSAFRKDLRDHIRRNGAASREQFNSLLSKHRLKLNSFDRKSREDANYFQNYIGQTFIGHSKTLQQFELLQKYRDQSQKVTIHSNKINAASFLPLNKIQENPLFRGAKDGSESQANDLIEQVYKKNSFAILNRNPDAIIVPMPSRTSKIPMSLANQLSKEYGNQVDINCQFLAHVQTKKEQLWSKILLKPRYNYPVVAGKKYFIADDIFVTGQHIKALKNHIEKGGGEVIGFACAASRNKTDISLSKDQILQAVKKFEKEDFNSYLIDFGIADNIQGLTPIELNYFLENFDTLGKLKERSIQEFSDLRNDLIDQAMKDSYEEIFKRMRLSTKQDAKNDEKQTAGGYNFEFSFSSMNEKGHVVYQDDSNDLISTSKEMQEFIADLSFLDLTSNESSFLKNQKILTDSIFDIIQSNEKNPFPSFESMIRALKAHGFDCKINYEKDSADGLMKIQKLIVKDSFKDTSIQLDFMKLQHYRYNKDFINTSFQTFCLKYPGNYKEKLDHFSNMPSDIPKKEQILLRTIYETNYSDIARSPSYFKELLANKPHLIQYMDKDKVEFIQKLPLRIPLQENRLRNTGDEGIYSVEQKQDDDFFLR